MKKMQVTHSMMSCFMDCRQKYQFQYVDLIREVRERETLFFGSAVHQALEMYLQCIQLNSSKSECISAGLNRLSVYFGMVEGKTEQAVIDENTPKNVSNFIKAAELYRGYVDRWFDEDVASLGVLGIESKFTFPLRAPGHRMSRKSEITGKIDGIIEIDGELFVMEHKTTSMLSDTYVSRIQIDGQVKTYALAIEERFKRPVKGVIYDILVKPSIVMRKGETDEEFAVRRAELIAKSKTGKSTAKQRIAETESEFRERVREEISFDDFQRIRVEFTRDELDRHALQIWDIAKDMQAPSIYRNPGNCMKYNQECPYLPLCIANGCMDGIEHLYMDGIMHEELVEGEEG